MCVNYINFIDLGLPSGTLWADRNLGAIKPEDAGLYFRFGELHPLTEDSEVYKPVPFSEEYDWKNGKDNTNIACTIYDVAQMKFNINSCIPNITQINELIECCNKEYTKITGTEGMKFTGPNGNYIFMPAGGRMENGICAGKDTISIVNEYGPEDENIKEIEIWGFYWGSNRIRYFREASCRKASAAAVSLAFSKDSAITEPARCRQGLLIRPTRYVNQSDNKWMEKFYLTDRRNNKYII